jgi:hypothetical protein
MWRVGATEEPDVQEPDMFDMKKASADTKNLQDRRGRAGWLAGAARRREPRTIDAARASERQRLAWLTAVIGGTCDVRRRQRPV